MAEEASLELEEEPRFQHLEWRVHRFGAVALVALVVAAVIGVFGHGPLAWTDTTSTSGGLEVAAPRFARRGGDVTMTISADASLARSYVAVDG